MKCPKCDTENRDGAKFCNECGNKLEIACPNCSNFNPPASKFCDECGQDLSAPTKAIFKQCSTDGWVEKYEKELTGLQ